MKKRILTILFPVLTLLLLTTGCRLGGGTSAPSQESPQAPSMSEPKQGLKPNAEVEPPAGPWPLPST